MKIARVAIDVPVPTLFDYRAEGLGAEDLGQRVVVPFGSKYLVGVVTAFATDSTVAPQRLKSVVRILRDVPALTVTDLQLIRFAATYYRYPLGAAIMGTLPSMLRRAGQRVTNRASRYVLTEAGAATEIDAVPARARTQRRLLAAFKEEEALDMEAIRRAGSTAARALRQLLACGWVRQAGDEVPPSARSEIIIAAGPALTREQSLAVDAIVDSLGRFSAFVLLGVTGSGKTEVYLQTIAAALKHGLQALLLVPEIVLTPQLEALVRSRFPATPVAILHSHLNEGARLQNWRAAQAGRAGIVLGTRLAVFAPIPNLGLIVVDEEHDVSFKQMDTLRYSARDLAVVRAKQLKIPVILGSATPALETYHNAVTGRYRLLQLTQRIGAPMPRIEHVDTRSARPVDGLSAELLDALATRIARREQSLVFINRRGYAPVLLCRACGWFSACQRCSARMVLHLRERALRCHHCGSQSEVPVACPGCGNQDLAPVGHGTQRIESALARHLPHARILRIDSDTTRRQGQWPAMRRRIHDRDVDILVGTQILAKGHDFPHLGFVAVLNSDSLLYSTDFRAPERLFALLMQVSGRAGRGDTRGTVLIQTDFPQHPLYVALCAQDYASFAESMLAERRQAGFPPFIHQALLRAEATRLATALAFLDDAARTGRELSAHVNIYDPVPANMVRRAGHERAQLLVQATSRQRLQEFLGEWYKRLCATPSTAARWSLDVDPAEF